MIKIKNVELDGNLLALVCCVIAVLIFAFVLLRLTVPINEFKAACQAAGGVVVSGQCVQEIKINLEKKKVTT